MSSRQNNQYPVPAHITSSDQVLPRTLPPGRSAESSPSFSNMNPNMQYSVPPMPQQTQPQQPQQAYSPRNPLEPQCGRKDNKVYRLEVRQQPIRARMCGFGDKDRRPITPPPCIRLSVCDIHGKEVEFNDVDSAFFVLTVDLWDEHGTHEVNLVRHASGTPPVSISNTTMTSYPPRQEQSIQPMYGSPSVVMPQQFDQYGRQIISTPQPSYPQPQMAQPPMSQNYYGHPPQQASPYNPAYGRPVSYAHSMPMPVSIAPPPSAQSMYTRNLIGSLTVNASRLKDVEDKPGFWFVLQDLSVRTEGMFRLKFNFVDVGSGQNNNQLNQGRAPVLATCFSDAFQVFSAKKFPGVIESTPLSKAFAGQGIKIPIRKDGPKSGRDNQDEYDADE